MSSSLQQVIKTGRIAALTLESLKQMQGPPRTYVAVGKACVWQAQLPLPARGVCADIAWPQVLPDA